jgi:transposase-like protein
MMTKSPSELTVLQYLVPHYAIILWDRGHNVKEIARILDRNHNTIRYHLKKAGRIGTYPKAGRPTDEMRAALTVRVKGVRLPAKLKALVEAKCGSATRSGSGRSGASRA